MEIFRHDAGVPRTAGSGNHPGHEIRKNPRKNQEAPAIPGTETKNRGSFLQVRGQRHSTGDDVEKDVPLRAQQHQKHRGDFQSATQTNQKQQNHREKRRGGNRSGHLRQRLSDAGKLRMRADVHTHGNGPQRPEEQRSVDAKKSERGAAQQIDVVFGVQLHQLERGVVQRQCQSRESQGSEKIAQPLARLLLFRRGEGGRGAARAHSQRKRNPVDDGAQQQAPQTNDDGSAAEEGQQRSLRRTGTFHLLKFEFISPHDHRPPDQLVQQDDYTNHGREAPEDRAGVAVAGGGLQK